MTLRHFVRSCLAVTFLASAAAASTLVIRDSIGPNPGSTNGMAGGLTLHDGSVWNTPGLVVTAPEDGELVEARFVIFGRGPGPVFGPENNLANVYGYPMKFHIWTDGVEGGADSFDLNPTGSPVTGHILRAVNSSTESFITVVPFGQTGSSNEFTTFLVTVDLSSFDIELDSGTQYVMGLIQDQTNFISGGGFFRISASRAVGFEDVFSAFNTDPSFRPGYVKTQLLNSFEQYAGSFTLSPHLTGDYDFDGDVDTFDYNKWRETFGSTANLMADGNDNNVVDAADYVVWRKHLGTMGANGSSRAPPAVPEPNAVALGLLSLVATLRRPRR